MHAYIEKYEFCTNQLLRAMDLTETRSYNSHKHVVWFDLMDTDKYGIPKLRILSKGKTLAFPHKIIFCVRGEYEGHGFTAELGTVTLTETRGW